MNVRIQRNYVPVVSDRDELIAYIGRLQRDLDERVTDLAGRLARRDKDAMKATYELKIHTLQRKVWALTEQLRSLRKQQ